MLLYLPLAHNYGRLMLLLGAHVGFTIAFLADPLRVGEALPQVRPTLLPSVPRVYEKVHSAVQSRASTRRPGVKRRLIDWALPIGREVSRLEGEGQARAGRAPGQAPRRRPARLQQGARAARRPPPHARSRAERRWRRRSPSSSTRSASGSRRATASPSARRRAARTAPTATASARSGSRCPGFEIRIADDGEIEVRSETVFQGYFKDPEATAAVLGAGRLAQDRATSASSTTDGFLRITDRKKDILVTAGGKNVAPQNIENDLKTSKYVSQALVVGDRGRTSRR